MPGTGARAQQYFHSYIVSCVRLASGL